MQELPDILKEVGIQGSQEEMLTDKERIERERDNVIRNQIIAGSRDLHMLYVGLLAGQNMENANNEKAESFAQLQNFFRPAVAQLAALYDSVNGMNRQPGADNSLDAVLANFPHTSAGEITTKYGLRTKVESLLNELQAKELSYKQKSNVEDAVQHSSEEVDVILP